MKILCSRGKHLVDPNNPDYCYQCEQLFSPTDGKEGGSKALRFIGWLIAGIIGFSLLAWLFAGAVDDGIQQADNEVYKVAHNNK